MVSSSSSSSRQLAPNFIVLRSILIFNFFLETVLIPIYSTRYRTHAFFWLIPLGISAGIGAHNIRALLKQSKYDADPSFDGVRSVKLQPRWKDCVSEAVFAVADLVLFIGLLVCFHLQFVIARSAWGGTVLGTYITVPLFGSVCIHLFCVSHYVVCQMYNLHISPVCCKCGGNLDDTMSLRSGPMLQHGLMRGSRNRVSVEDAVYGDTYSDELTSDDLSGLSTPPTLCETIISSLTTSSGTIMSEAPPYTPTCQVD